MVAEACGNRTHLARVRRHAGFEDQEGHQAQSASVSLFQQLIEVRLFEFGHRCPMGVYRVQPGGHGGP